MFKKLPFQYIILMFFIFILVIEILMIQAVILPAIDNTHQWIITIIEMQGEVPGIDFQRLSPEKYVELFRNIPDVGTFSFRGIYSDYNRGDWIFIFENPVNHIYRGINNLFLLTSLLFIMGYLLLLRKFNQRFIDPIHYLKDLVNKEVYNILKEPKVYEKQESTELFDLTRGVREILTELKNRNEALLNQSQEFLKMSFTDGLTGLNNRAALNHQLDDESLWMSPTEPVSFILMDIDFFKQYNDTYGHLKGDDVLKRVARIFANVFYSPNDFWARYGGEEFAVLMRKTAIGTALKTCQRFQRHIKDLGIEHKTSRISNNLTCSIGIATTIPGFYFDSLTIMDTADDALYQSKEKGRNCITAMNPQYNPQEFQELTLL